MERLKQQVSLVLRALLLTFVAGLVAEFIRPLHDLEAYLGDHPAVERAWIELTLGLTLLGILLLAGTQLIVHVGDERSAHRRDFQARSRSRIRSSGSGRERRRTTYRFRGRTAGVGFSDQASFSELKSAWRRGAWRRDPRLLRISLMMVGALCVMYGLFGMFIVVGPPWIKLICIFVLSYATLRTVWGFWQA